MKIESEDKQASLIIESCGAELSAYPSLCVSIELTSREVSGVLAEVWIELDKMYPFLDALVSLDAARKGEAVLESMSPGELSLRIFPLDSRGHLGLDIKLTGSRLIDDNLTRKEYGCHTSFEIDATVLPYIRNDLSELIRKQKEETA